MGFRDPVLTAIDPVARSAAAAAAVPQKVLSTADSGPRVVVEQIDLPNYVPAPGSPVPVVDAAAGRLRFFSDGGAAGELSVTSGQIKRQLMLSAGAWRGAGTMPDYPDGFPSPYLLLAHSTSEQPPGYFRQATIGNIERLLVDGELQTTLSLLTRGGYSGGGVSVGNGIAATASISTDGNLSAGGAVVIGSTSPSAGHAVRRDWIDARIQGGSATFSFPLAATTYSQTVTFSPALAAAPAIAVIGVTSNPQNYDFSIGGITNSSFTLYGRAAVTGSTSVRWIATAL